MPFLFRFQVLIQQCLLIHTNISKPRSLQFVAKCYRFLNKQIAVVIVLTFIVLYFIQPADVQRSSVILIFSLRLTHRTLPHTYSANYLNYFLPKEKLRSLWGRLMGFGRKVWNYGVTNCKTATTTDHRNVESKKTRERQTLILFTICSFTDIS